MKKLFSIFSIFLYFFLFQTNILAFTFKQSSADLKSVTEGIRGINFNPDGTIMYVWDSPGDNMLQYALSTPYDLDTMTLTYETDIEEIGLGHHIEFNSDGTEMFIIDNDQDRVEQFTLATAWDTSNVTHNGFFTIPTENQPRGIAFKPDGTKVFLIGDDDEKIRSFTLDVAWDITETSTPGVTSDRTNNYENKPKNLQFNSDGTVLYIAGENGDDINKLTLSTAYDTSSSSLDVTQTATTYDISAQSENMRGFVFIDNSSVTSLGHAAKIFVTDDILNEANTIKHYFINADPTLSSCSPADGATGVGVSDNIILTFNEIVDVESGNVIIKNSSDDTVFEAIDITGSKVSGTGTTEITINPNETFVINSDYYITIDASAFDDVDGASYAGINDSTTCNFSTGQSNPLLDDKDLVGSIEAQVEMSHRVIRQTTNVIMHRIEWLRRHKDQENLTNQNIKFQFSEPIFASLSNVIPIAANNDVISQSLPNNWFLWSEGQISIGDIEATSGSSRKEIDTNGITIGADNRINSNKMYGIAVRFGEDDVDVGSLGTTVDTDAYSLGLYGTLSPNDDNFLDGIVGMSTLKSELIRKKNSDSLKGERDGKQVFSSINFSKMFNENDFSFNPTARLDFGYTELGDYNETGKNALTYEKQEILTGIASIGTIFNNTKKNVNGFTLKKNGRLEYSTDFSPSSDAKLSYSADPTTDYTLTVGNEATHNIRAGFGFDLSTDDGFSIIVNYERYQKKGSGYTDSMHFTAGWISNRRTQYALNLNGIDNISSGLNIVKDFRDFNLKFNIDTDLLNNNKNHNANISINKVF
jgi:hypothetical protein